MSKKKAFLLGFSLTLAVLVPVYLAVCAYGLSRTAPVEQKQQGVPVVQPLSTDARTLALMTGEGGPQTFVLVRFDAYEGRITTAALDAQTVVLCGGQVSGVVDARTTTKEEVGLLMTRFKKEAAEV